MPVIVQPFDYPWRDLLCRRHFPGMDPYIEACGLWEDFHNDLISHIAIQLADVAPERYVVRTGQRSYLVLVQSEGKKEHPFLPDVSVAMPRRPEKRRQKGRRRALSQNRLPRSSPISYAHSSKKSIASTR